MKKEEQKPLVSEDKTLLASVDTQEETSPYGVDMEFMKDAQKQKDIIADIKSYVNEVIAQRTDLGIEDEWTDAIDLDEGVTGYRNFPHDNAHNLHIHITFMTDQILKEKIKRQVFVRPLMLMRAVPGKAIGYAPESVSRKEKWTDYRVHTDMDLEEALDPVINDAIVLGTGFVKTKHTKKISKVRDIEVYDASKPEDKPKEIARFIDDFKDDKDKPEYKDGLNRLRKGESVEMWVEKEEIEKYCPEPKYVDPFNLYIDCYTPLEYQRIIAEKIENVSWQELERYFNGGDFSDDVRKGIIEKYGNQNKKYRESSFTIWECNYMYSKGEGKKATEIRTIVTYIEEYDELLAKGISFPYTTRKPNYEMYKILNRRGNCIYGIGLPKLLKDTNVAINEYNDLLLDATEYDIAPQLKVKNGSSFDPTKESSFGSRGPATYIWLDDIEKDLAPMQRFPLGVDVYKVVEYLHRYAEYISGVSAYMTGREAPNDPNAPASKAYMLLQESNLRINAYIRKIHSSNKRLFAQFDKMYYQYFNESIKYYGVEEGGKYQEQDITRKEIGIPVEYIPQMSDITINKAQEFENNLKMAEFLMKQPMVTNLPTGMRTIIEIVLRSAYTGQWDKYIDKLLPDQQETDIVSKTLDLMKQAGGPEGVIGIMQQLIPQQAGVGTSPSPTPGVPA